MKRSRVCKYGLIVFSLIIIFALMTPDMSYAFKNNGPRSSSKGYAQTISNYIVDYKHANGKKYYGTHDWLAERALKVLYYNLDNIYLSDNAKDFIRKLYDFSNPLELRYYYLLGSEAPDEAVSYHSIKFTDCLGKPYGTFNVGANWKDHLGNIIKYGSHSKLHFTNGNCDDDSLSSIAEYHYQCAVEAFRIRDCQKAAFFLGAVAHGIADAVCYPHLLAPTDFEPTLGVTGDDINSHRISWINRINYLTYKKESLGNGEFFSLSEVQQNILKPIRLVSAKALSKAAGYYLIQRNYHKELWEKFQNNREDYFPANKNELLDWDQNTWNDFNLEQTDYFSKVQEILNVAVLHIARTLIIASTNYFDCECNKDKTIDEEDLLKKRSPNLRMDRFFLYLAMAASTLPFVLLGKFMIGKAK